MILKLNSITEEIKRKLNKTGANVYHGDDNKVALKGGELDELLSELNGSYDIISDKSNERLVGKIFKDNTIVDVNGLKIGGNYKTFIGGPCAVESKEQIFEIAKLVKEQGGDILRGGAFKPRTSPYAFQGLGEEGLKYLKEAGEKYGLSTVSEAMSPEHLDMVASYVDVVQVGARNMSNFSMLKECGNISNPVILKRGPSATYDELLNSAEYIMSGGNENIILCERGIRTFNEIVRNTFDIAAIPVLKSMTHLPVIADPSHGCGIREVVPGLAKASMLVGADGVIIEVHNKPEEALCDGAQSILPEDFGEIVERGVLLNALEM